MTRAGKDNSGCCKEGKQTGAIHDQGLTARSILAEFRAPGPAWRGKPFWSWNGKLEKKELLRQIHVIKEMGFGGFFMHSRTGLATEYLGDEWFDLINACADEGERLGLEAWLYDEDRWPSGSAGGMATENPAYRMKYLRLRTVPADEFAWDDDLIAAFSCTLDGINYSDCARIERSTPPGAYAGQTILAFSTEVMPPLPFYNGNAYLDTLNREAVEHFIHLTHEQYKAHCGDRLGRSIVGIFTDEPHRGMVMCENVAHNPGADPKMVVPWTPGLLSAFQERFGYDLVPRLPELYLRPEGRRISQVKWHFMEHLQQRFLDCWAKPIHDWCRRNKLILTGHVLHEDSLGSQAVPCGSLMRYYEYMDYPGVDVLTEGNRSYWIVKQLASAARQLGQKWLLSELYGCTGWQMDFEAHKAVGAWQALFGINLRCPHLSWYTMEGEAKRDYPASILHQSAWYKEYEPVETYFSRMNVPMTRGTPVCDILVLNPIESAWCQIYTGWATWLSAQAPEVVALDRTYQQLFHWLSGAHFDFDYGDEDHVKRLHHIERSDGQVRLRIGQATYSTVVVAGMETIRSTTLDVLEEFVQAGGTVIVAGDPPSHVDALPSSRPLDLAARVTHVPFGRESVTAACAASAPRPITFLDSHQQAAVTEILSQARRDGERLFALALNVNREQWHRQVRVRFSGAGYVQEWDCMTGDRYRVPARSGDGYVEFSADFAPSGTHLYALVPGEDTTLAIRPSFDDVERLPLEGPYAYTLDEPNICVLDRAAYSLNDGPWQAPREILKADRAIRTALDLPLRGGEMLQPWFVEQRPARVAGEVALRFAFHVECMPQGPVHLLLERPESFQTSINGVNLPSKAAEGWMIDPCLKRLCFPAGALQRGENVVELRASFLESTNLEALYLTGPFGVRVEGTGRTLVALPDKLRAGTVTTQGLPFYSGRIRYGLELPRLPAAGERFFLAVDDFEGACVAVRAPGDDLVLLPWTPYEAEITDLLQGAQVDFEVVLTRRNTFGPLHQIPLKAPAYGPQSYVTQGERFTDDYMLYPAGLLKRPAVLVRRAKY